MYIMYMRSYFFLFKQKTAYAMRISDWSSDVCSSDLERHDHVEPRPERPGVAAEPLHRPFAPLGHRLDAGEDRRDGQRHDDDHENRKSRVHPDAPLLARPAPPRPHAPLLPQPPAPVPRPPPPRRAPLAPAHVCTPPTTTPPAYPLPPPN